MTNDSASRYAKAASLFRDYARAPSKLVATSELSPRDRATSMLQSRIERCAQSFETDRDAIVSTVVEGALARVGNRPPPVYVVGLGGSGSHWLTAMLAEMLPLIDLGEAPVPADLLALIDPLSAEEQGFVVDCLHLSYAYADLAPEEPARGSDIRVVHSAIPLLEPRHKRWDPACFAIRLLRDPRDQVTCAVYRKGESRRRRFPGASDERLLTGLAAHNARNYSETRSSPVRADFTCYYEEMKTSAPTVLMQLAAALGLPVETETAARVAREHDATRMRSGELPYKGNLTPFESNGWREETGERQKLILHAHLADAVTSAGYPTDDCLGRPLELCANRDARRLSFNSRGGLGVLFSRAPGSRQWIRMGEARGKIAVDPAFELKLRVHEQASPESIGTLAKLPEDGVDSLCMAGSTSLDDELLGICAESLRDLRELDVARTGVDDTSIVALASLRRLVGLSLFGAKLSPDGLASLRAALPSTTIRY